MDRRRFLAASGAVAAAAPLTAPWVGRVHAEPPSRPRRVALIGSGWYGKVDLLRLIQVADVEVVALCDADSRMLADAAKIVAGRQKSGKTPRTYGHYEKLLAEHDLDIVLVDTPDHWHALPMIAACEAGADVWVQKPISVDIREGQAMLATARRTGATVQVGTQRRSTPHLIEAKERVVEAGLLGEIAHAEVYCYYHMRSTKNPPNTEPPEYLDYEYWTGPAPMRPYNELVHPRTWRAFMEYGNGIVGDMCIHMLDLVRWMLDLGWPTRVSSSGGILVDKDAKANVPDTQTALFEYPGLPVVWTHRTWGDPPDPDYPWGATLYGTKGTLRLSVHKYDFEPTGDGEPLHGEAVYEYDEYPEDKTEERLERHVAAAIRKHWRDFLAAIDEGTRPVADIEEGHISTATCILANLSLATGRTLAWDAEAGTIVGDEQADRLLAREYHNGYKHPTP